MMLRNIKLDINGCKKNYIARLQTSLVQFLSNGTTKNEVGNNGILAL